MKRRALNRTITALLLLGGTGAVLPFDARAQGLQYCAERYHMSPSNQCFGSLSEAEDFLREEPSPPKGASMLTLREELAFFNSGIGSRRYWVTDTSVERPGEDWYSAFVTGYFQWFNCGVPITPGWPSSAGCREENDLVALLPPVYPGGSWALSGSYLPESQVQSISEAIGQGLWGTWNPLFHGSAQSSPTPVDGGIAGLYLNHSLGNPDPRRVTFVDANGNGGSFGGAISRMDQYLCPNLMAALGYGVGSYSTGLPVQWPTICSNGTTGRINVIAPFRQIQSCPKDGNPCVPATGAKELAESDFTWSGVAFERHYSSLGELPLTAAMGDVWSHTFAHRLYLQATPGSDVVWIDDKGHYELFDLVSSGRYAARNGTGTVLFDLGGSATERWKIVRADASELAFDAAGRLVRMGRPGSALSLAYCSSADITGGSCDIVGTLREVSTEQGRTLRFHYDRIDWARAGSPGVALESPRLVAIVSDEGTRAQYGYDAFGRLNAVLMPSPMGDSLRSYHYAEPTHLCRAFDGSAVPDCDPAAIAVRQPNLLTGIEDEGESRWADYTYDGQGRVTRSSHSGAGLVTLNYVDGATVRVSQPTGSTRRYVFDGTPLRRLLSAEEEVTDGSATGTASYAYLDGRTTSRIDARGNRTDYVHDAFRETTRTEGLTSTGATTASTRTIATTWDDTLNRPLTRIEQGRTTSWTYNARGQVTTRTTTDPAIGASRTTTIAYCEQTDVDGRESTCPILGLVKSVDGPRTDVADVTTYTYYPATDESGCAGVTGACHRQGDLWKVTNALGHVVETLRYDREGRVRATRDPNGTVTEFAYHPRGWLVARTVKGVPPAIDAVTAYTYDETGLVTRVTQPDGDRLDYTYDDAHRLVAVEDNLGNRIEYTLDAAGKHIAEHTRDPSGAVRRSLGRVYDQLGRLRQQLDAQGRITGYDYDANGNATRGTDALLTAEERAFDPLDRLARTLRDAGGIDAEIAFERDALDRLVRVTDPKGLDTAYVYDGLGNLLQQTSPDTGVTSYTYDAAGNRLSETDARGVTATFAYDALDRLVSASYPDSSLNVTLAYDQGNGVTGCVSSAPLGRLTTVTDGSGSTTYCYDSRGNVSSKTVVAGGLSSRVGYFHSPGDRLLQIDYPGGTSVVYSRDATGRIETVSYAGRSLNPIVTSARYVPFGPLERVDFKGGASQRFGHDQNYRPDGVFGTALDLGLATDAIGNIVRVEDSSVGEGRGLAYDALSRLTRFDDGGNALIEGFTYDATGNRLSHESGAGVVTYGYAASSHRLSGVDTTPRSHDAAGSLSDRGDGWTFEYNDQRRLATARLEGDIALTHRYNGKGERVYKVSGSGPGAVTHLYVYDEAGRLLAEYRRPEFGLAVLQREYVWLDNRLIALLPRTGAYSAEVLHVHSDHLGTPRAITRPADDNTVVWRWNLTGSAFGDHAADNDPDFDRLELEFNLRYPGQYFDAETGLHYNYFRDYEPGTGRYVESDPIGLLGGSSTYSYVRSNPFGRSDASGLVSFSFGGAAHAQIPGIGGQAVGTCGFDTNGVVCCQFKLCARGSFGGASVGGGGRVTIGGDFQEGQYLEHEGYIEGGLGGRVGAGFGSGGLNLEFGLGKGLACGVQSCPVKSICTDQYWSRGWWLVGINPAFLLLAGD